MKVKFIIAGVILAGVIIFLVLGLGIFTPEKKFDKYFSVSRNSYRPYDTKFFYDELKRNSDTRFRENNESFAEPVYSLINDSSSTIVVVSPYFYPRPYAIQQLKSFAAKGNIVFICAFGFSSRFTDSLYYSPKSDQIHIIFPPLIHESRWGIDWKGEDSTTSYPLFGHKPVTTELDSIYALGNNLVTNIDILASDNLGNIQMLEMTCGKGRIFFCNNPIIVSNYFLLYKNNYTLFNRLAEKLKLKENNIVWDDYYRKISNENGEEDSFGFGQSRVLKVIFEHPPLTWAFYTFLAGALLFILIYFRRIQQAVPVQAVLKNDSRTYIQVVSGFYWQQQNHKSIADKIIAQFFEYLFQHFHIHAKDFQETELDRISHKTGRSLNNIKEIFAEINFIRSEEEITGQTLVSLYQKINVFYQDQT